MLSASLEKWSSVAVDELATLGKRRGLLPAGRLIPGVLLSVVIEVVELPVLCAVLCPSVWTLASVWYLQRRSI